MLGPDTTITLDFALARIKTVIDRLIVYPENMMRNLEALGGVIHSQQVLLALTQAGVSRETAYGAVQEAAIKAVEGGTSFLDLLKNDARVANAINEPDLQNLFSLGYHTKNIDVIFSRVFLED